MGVYKKQNILIAWLIWHFYQMPEFLLGVWKNYLVFCADYFSIPLLLMTLFSPWKKTLGRSSRKFDIGEWAGNVIFSLFSRLVGAMVRLLLIFVGALAEVVVGIIGIIGIAVCLLWPFALLALATDFWLVALCLLPLAAGLELYFFIWGVALNIIPPARLQDVLNWPDQYDLTDFLSREARGITARAGRFCQSKKITYSSTALLYAAVLINADVQLLVARLGIDVKKITQDLKNYLEKQGRVDKADVAPLSSWEGVMLDAARLAQEGGLPLISEKELLAALAKHDPFFKQVLVEHELKEQDVRNLALWLGNIERALAKRRQFWLKENLARAGSLGKDWASGFTVTLDQFSIDWTRVGQSSVFGDIVGHANEVEEVETVLAKSSLRNALLVGAEGSGRKSIAKAVARRAYLDMSLPEINRKRLVELDMVSLLAKVQDAEKVESLLDQIFREVIAAGNVILIIDNLEHFVANKAPRPGTVDISGILARYLGMPDFQFIGITSFEGLHRELENNPSFLEYFSKVEVAEVSEADTINILQNLALGMERRSGLFVPYPSVREAVALTGRYMPSEPFPKKAIDVLEEAVSYARSQKERVVLPSHIAKVISDKTQIPVGKMEGKEKNLLLNLEQLLAQKIVGQKEAVADISVAMRRSRAGISSKKRPMGTFLFLGPTGVGKTETAKALADIYFNGQEKMIRLDMSEFQSLADIPRLLGAVSPVEQQGLLTTPVRENPFSLVLLDEIEKAHKDILNLMLQVLDDGHLTDGQGRKIMFSNTIIICTSNAGAQDIFKAAAAGTALQKDALLAGLFEKGLFRPEFVNRFDATVIFNPLTKENLVDIAQLMLASLAKNLQEKEVELIITQPLKQKIVELSYKPEFGAREMRRVMQDKVENAIAQALLEDKITKGNKIEINPENFQVVVIK